VTPMVATWLIERTGNDLSPAYLIMAAAAVTFIALLRTEETFRKPMQLARIRSG
jgi:MFS transporter, MHS family, proline/betaine transporter